MSLTNFLSKGSTVLGYAIGYDPREPWLRAFMQSLNGSTKRAYELAMRPHVTPYRDLAMKPGAADFEYSWMPVAAPMISSMTNPFVDWENWTGIIVVRERSLALGDVLHKGYGLVDTFGEWETLDTAAARWVREQAKEDAGNAVLVAQAIATPLLDDIVRDLSRASYLFSEATVVVRARLIALYANPTQASWDDAHTLVVSPLAAPLQTLWSAVRAIDQTFQANYGTQTVDRWERIPTRELIRDALRYAADDDH